MGLKDWFGGDKKKAELREKVKEAVSDGKLTADKVQEIEALRRELDTSGASDDKTQYRRETFNTAVGAIKAKGQLSPAEEAELAKIQQYLNLRDDQVQKTKMDLGRFRALSEIRKGKLPVVSPTNTALRGVTLEPGEVPHSVAAAELFDTMTDAGTTGNRLPAQVAYSAKDTLPLKEAKSIGEGFVIITSQRLLFKGAQLFPLVTLQKPSGEIYAYPEGLRLRGKKRHTMLRFRDQGSVELASVILAKLLAA